MILNPLSHDNSESPIFKREVEAVFGILSEFDKISNEVIRKVTEGESSTINLSIQDSNGDWHNYKFQVLDNIRRLKQNGIIGYAPCRFQMKKYKKNDEDWVEKIEKPNEMRVLYDKICKKHNVAKQHFADNYKNNHKILLSNL